MHGPPRCSGLAWKVITGFMSIHTEHIPHNHNFGAPPRNETHRKVVLYTPGRALPTDMTRFAAFRKAIRSTCYSSSHGSGRCNLPKLADILSIGQKYVHTGFDNTQPNPVDLPVGLPALQLKGYLERRSTETRSLGTGAVKKVGCTQDQDLILIVNTPYSLQSI